MDPQSEHARYSDDIRDIDSEANQHGSPSKLLLIYSGAHVGKTLAPVEQ